ncbi:hypothetical protein CRG49_008125 [Neisseria sp. N95_16]|nr:hypothetical protein CRG49_008125 [Neisseria sp. N95_16]
MFSGVAVLAAAWFWLAANQNRASLPAFILQLVTSFTFIHGMNLLFKSRRVYAPDCCLAVIADQAMMVCAAAVDWPTKNRFGRLIHHEGDRYDGLETTAVFDWYGIQNIRLNQKRGKEILWIDVSPEHVYFSHHGGTNLDGQGWDNCVIALRLDLFAQQERQNLLCMLKKKTVVSVV